MNSIRFSVSDPFGVIGDTGEQLLLWSKKSDVRFQSQKQLMFTLKFSALPNTLFMAFSRYSRDPCLSQPSFGSTYPDTDLRDRPILLVKAPSLLDVSEQVEAVANVVV